MTAFRLDRAVDVKWRPSLAPWRMTTVDIKGGAGEVLEVPNELTFALAKDLEDWGYPVTWIDRPAPDEIERQREMALAANGYIGPSITLSRHTTHPESVPRMSTLVAAAPPSPAELTQIPAKRESLSRLDPPEVTLAGAEPQPAPAPARPARSSPSKKAPRSRSGGRSR